MKTRIIALCVACAVFGCSFGCVRTPKQEQNIPIPSSEIGITQQELPSETQTALSASEPPQQTVSTTQSAVTQTSAEEIRNENTFSSSNALTPTNADFDTLGKILIYYGLDRIDYDCTKDSFIKILAYNLGGSGTIQDDPYGMVKDNDCHFYNSEYIDTPDGLKRVASDPQHRLDCNGYFELREEALIYIKENLFNNYLPLEKEYFIDDDTPDCTAYYYDGWYYFSAGMGGGPAYYSKYLSCTPTENGHYLIGIESICNVDDQVFSKMTIDATLVEKDGLRMWKINTVSNESRWNTGE